MGDTAVSRTLNLLGYLCPVPVTETRKALSEMSAGSVLELHCDDPDVSHDIPALVKRIGSEIISIEELDGRWCFRILAAGGESA